MTTAEEVPIAIDSTRLQRELKQTKPFGSKEQEAFLALLRTGDACKLRFTQLFETEGVTFQQYNVLRIIRGSGEKGLPTLEIGERMIERTPGVTRIVDRLEAKALVARVRGVTDRRKVWCRITLSGLELLARLDDPTSRTDRAVFEGLAPEELDELLRLLDAVRTGLSDPT